MLESEVRSVAGHAWIRGGTGNRLPAVRGSEDRSLHASDVNQTVKMEVSCSVRV